ncbi:pyridoxamine 5'-phosphate oxidase family protein [Herbiconiux sp. CPCC 205763]|uniref:Pyridoxamine 5'-phosphate oxidase family protein n=1 Tax=Herbiconiux aconitum TaxID=2970913 RepID=A0ABT2GMX8_9MICO|nr:pyridoxamine 5'-phosphate oxidase family protein [Herbiconiux aconitum]MCS5717579.1 pyridoxamine 5'-phosphate oxidase family protein [Herbiconiux aconitum]
MSKHYGSIAFTDSVRAIQSERGSGAFYGARADKGLADPGADPLTAAERDYLAEQDGFYLASVSATGWPYVQYRGGPPGFIRTIDENTIGWADFRGNLQYVSAGNVTDDDRVAIIVLDYARRQRLKIFGRARIVTVDENPELMAALDDHDYEAVVERGILISVEAYDWNCPQHITPRFTELQVNTAVEPLRARIAALEAENAALRGASKMPPS